MLSFQRELIWEKVRSIPKKDIGYVFRGVKILLTPRVAKSIDIYWLDMPQDLSFFDKSIDEKMSADIRQALRIEVLSDENRVYFEAYLALRSEDFLTREMVDQILAEGGLIFLVMKEEQIVAANTLVFKRYRLRGGFDLDFVIQPGQVYSCHTYVAPELRNQRVSLFLKKHTFAYCAENGYQVKICAIYPFNKPSIKSVTNCGFRKYGTIMLVEQFMTKRHRFMTYLEDKRKLVKLHLFGKEEIFV